MAAIMVAQSSPGAVIVHPRRSPLLHQRYCPSMYLCGAVASDGARFPGGAGPTRATAESDALNKLRGRKIVDSARS